MNLLFSNRRARSAAGVLIALSFLSGCASRDFSRSWRVATAAAEHDGIEGPWQGTWKSEATGHEGKLRCVVSPASSGDGSCDFSYWASWGGVLCGEFDVAYAVRVKDGKYHVSGKKDLGKLGGGVYAHTGTADETHFEATYLSKADHGVFKMTRPPKPAAPPLPPPAARTGNPATRFPRSPSRATP